MSAVLPPSGTQTTLLNIGASIALIATAAFAVGELVPIVTQLPVGAVQIITTIPFSAWPAKTDCVSFDVEISYDNEATWQPLGGMVCQVPAQAVDMYLGPVTGAYAKDNLPQPANAQTFVRHSPSVLVSVTMGMTLKAL
jgi:hypothetical protein